jgi:proline iminopeptidase
MGRIGAVKSTTVRAKDGTPLHVGVVGDGPEVVVLSGGPGCVNYLEAIRTKVGAESWTVLGHSWGSDLAIRYALDHPERVRAVVGVAGHGLHEDRLWSEVYSSLSHTEHDFVIEWEPTVHESLKASFGEWIHQPELFRRLADTAVPMTFVAAAEDIRPDWPLRQLAALVPSGEFVEIAGVPHNFWSTHPATWTDVVSDLCRGYHLGSKNPPRRSPHSV